MQKVRAASCGCAVEFEVDQLRASDYARVKKLLDRGRHPTFIGRNLVKCCALNGGVLVFHYVGQAVGVAVVNPAINTLLVLNVLPAHRGHGLGRAIVSYLQCNFARVIEGVVPFFERCGYQAMGDMHQGKAFRTQVMIKSTLIPLAGRVARVYRQFLTTEKKGPQTQAD